MLTVKSKQLNKTTPCFVSLKYARNLYCKKFKIWSVETNPDECKGVGLI